jgi:hypothetical protein
MRASLRGGPGLRFTQLIVWSAGLPWRGEPPAVAGFRRESSPPFLTWGFVMPVYMYQAAYTAESMAAQIREPHDRIEAVRPALEALGPSSWRLATRSANMTCWSSMRPLMRP